MNKIAMPSKKEVKALVIISAVILSACEDARNKVSMVLNPQEELTQIRCISDENMKPLELPKSFLNEYGELNNKNYLRLPYEKRMEYLGFNARCLEYWKDQYPKKIEILKPLTTPKIGKTDNPSNNNVTFEVNNIENEDPLKTVKQNFLDRIHALGLYLDENLLNQFLENLTLDQLNFLDSIMSDEVLKMIIKDFDINFLEEFYNLYKTNKNKLGHDFFKLLKTQKDNNTWIEIVMNTAYNEMMINNPKLLSVYIKLLGGDFISNLNKNEDGFLDLPYSFESIMETIYSMDEKNKNYYMKKYIEPLLEDVYLGLPNQVRKITTTDNTKLIIGALPVIEEIVSVIPNIEITQRSLEVFTNENLITEEGFINLYKEYIAKLDIEIPENITINDISQDDKFMFYEAIISGDIGTTDDEDKNEFQEYYEENIDFDNLEEKPLEKNKNSDNIEYDYIEGSSGGNYNIPISIPILPTLEKNS
jgi:hypothetical protein